MPSAGRMSLQLLERLPVTPPAPRATPRPLTIDDPLHAPDAQHDEEADGVPGAPGPIGHGGGHHRGQGQDDHGPVKHLGRQRRSVPKAVLVSPLGTGQAEQLILANLAVSAQQASQTLLTPHPDPGPPQAGC